jgi:hypothetical protein
MGAMVGDQLVPIGRRNSVVTVVALCIDPAKAWVVNHFNHGLVDGSAYVIELREYAVIDQQSD